MSETTSTSGGGVPETTPTSGGGVSGTAATSGDAENQLLLPLPSGHILSGMELLIAGEYELALLGIYTSTTIMDDNVAGNQPMDNMTNLLASLPNEFAEFADDDFELPSADDDFEFPSADDDFEFASEESEQGDVVSISSSDVLDDASDEPAPQPSPPSSTSASDTLGDASDEPAPHPSPPSSENSAS